MQLLENIMKNELHFPSHITDLSPSCIDLCWKLLRRDPGTTANVALLYMA